LPHGKTTQKVVLPFAIIGSGIDKNARITMAHGFQEDTTDKGSLTLPQNVRLANVIWALGSQSRFAHHCIFVTVLARPVRLLIGVSNRYATTTMSQKINALATWEGSGKKTYVCGTG
jgi:hypothetical protein